MNESERETVLYEFSVEPIHDKATLERYLKLYPEIAADLLDLSFELQISASQAPLQKEVADSRASEAWKKFIASGRQLDPASDPVNIFAHFTGVRFGQLAAALKTPKSILLALRNRQVEPTTIPSPYLNRLASAMNSDRQTIERYFSSSPLILGTTQFKANQKPFQQERVSFQKLIADTPMSEEERKNFSEALED